MSDEQITHQINTNVIGSIQVTREVLPHLRAQGGGRILQLSSALGQVALPAMSIYSASKWAMEGFFESLVQEVAPFNIQVTLVEPGGARTNFSGSSASMGEVMEVYGNTPLGYMRKMAIENSNQAKGDPVKMAKAMIAAADAEVPPLRLLLGSDAYEFVHKSLTSRLATLEAQKDIAYSTDIDA